MLKHVGGDHAHDSVVMYIKEEKILFLGDCIYADIFLKWNYTTKRTFALIDELENLMLRHIFSLMGSDKSRGVLQEIRMLKQ